MLAALILMGTIQSAIAQDPPAEIRNQSTDNLSQLDCAADLLRRSTWILGGNPEVNLSRSVVIRSEGVVANHTWSNRFPENSVAAILDGINSNNIERLAGMNQILGETEAAFDRLGIQSIRIRQTNGMGYLRILPIRPLEAQNVHLLNRLAAGLKKYDSGFEMRFDPFQIGSSTKDGDQASVGFDQTSDCPVLNMGYASAIEGLANDPTLVHEVLHARTLGLANEGRFSAYNSAVLALSPEERVFPVRRDLLYHLSRGHPMPTYFDFMQFDELLTWRYNLWEVVRRYGRLLRMHSPLAHDVNIEVRNCLAMLSLVARRTEETTSLANRALAALERRNSSWREPVNFQNADSRYSAYFGLPISRQGGRFASLSVEERSGRYSSLNVRTNFRIEFRVSNELLDEDLPPRELMLHQIASLQQAAGNALEVTDRGGPTREAILELDQAEHLTDARREVLLTQIESATNRNRSLPGYPGQRPVQE